LNVRKHKKYYRIKCALICSVFKCILFDKNEKQTKQYNTFITGPISNTKILEKEYN